MRAIFSKATDSSLTAPIIDCSFCIAGEFDDLLDSHNIRLVAQQGFIIGSHTKYRDNPYRAVNFPVDENGILFCPNGKKFHFLRTAPVKGNQYGRTEELYQCEDCEGCTHREQCHKSQSNRTIRLNEELTGFHAEVLNNLNPLDFQKNAEGLICCTNFQKNMICGKKKCRNPEKWDSCIFLRAVFVQRFFCLL